MRSIPHYALKFLAALFKGLAHGPNSLQLWNFSIKRRRIIDNLVSRPFHSRLDVFSEHCLSKGLDEIIVFPSLCGLRSDAIAARPAARGAWAPFAIVVSVLLPAARRDGGWEGLQLCRLGWPLARQAVISGGRRQVEPYDSGQAPSLDAIVVCV